MKGCYRVKIKQNLYDQAKMDSRQITEIATQLAFLTSLEKQSVLIKDKIRSDYEESRLRDVKNLITNIYLSLDLHEIRGMADQIFNADFKPKD
jgi:hypothetical protein